MCGFLSRLCGGEPAGAAFVFGINFLSRLCGGEHAYITFGASMHFLSRLCGGERFGFEHESRPVFSKPPMRR